MKTRPNNDKSVMTAELKANGDSVLLARTIQWDATERALGRGAIRQTIQSRLDRSTAYSLQDYSRTIRNIVGVELDTDEVQDYLDDMTRDGIIAYVLVGRWVFGKSAAA